MSPESDKSIKLTSSNVNVLEAIKKLGKEILPEGSEITLFGSRARYTAREDSDWDIHILVPGPEKISLALTGDYAVPFLELGYDLGVDIEPIVHTFSGWEKRSFLPLYKNIQNDGIKL